MTTPGFTHPPAVLVAISLAAAAAILLAVALLTPSDPRVFGPRGGVDPSAALPRALPRFAPNDAPRSVPVASRGIATPPGDIAAPDGVAARRESIVFARPSLDERLLIPDGVRRLPWKGVLLHGGIEGCPAARTSHGAGAFHFRVERGVLTEAGEEVLGGEALEVLPRWREQRSAVNFATPQVILDEEPWIGVLVDGAITQKSMTDGQLRTVVDLVLSLEREGFLEAPIVRRHEDLEPCGCPGPGLRVEEIERWLMILRS